MEEAAYVRRVSDCYDVEEPTTGVRLVRTPHPKELSAGHLDEIRAYANASRTQQHLWDARSEYGCREDY